MDAISAQLTQKAMTGLGGLDTTALKSPSTHQFDQTNFSKLLDNQMQTGDTTNAKLMEFVENFASESTSEPMKAIPAGEIQIDVAKAGEVEKNTVTKSNNIFEIFKEVNSTQANMDQVMETLTSGKKLSTMEMTRLQVLAHMNTVNMEVISKVGEMANRAIQTPFQMQVG